LTIIAGIAGLANLVCFIIVLIKLFQEKGPLHGILGFFCSLYTFIWGWMSAGALNIKNIMIIWTVSILIYMATGGAAMASMMKQMQDLG
jgi:hypothetical protein